MDGDTIHVLLDGRDVTVRYIGIDTPETVDPRKPVEAFGKEAAEANRQLVEGRTVQLEKDTSETDSFGRLLRYVYIQDSTGERMVNAELVRAGFARVSTYPPDVKYADLFLQLEREARAASAGLWAPTTSAPTSTIAATPAPTRTVTPTVVATVAPTPKPTAAPTPVRTLAPTPMPAANCDAAYPTVCIPPFPPDLNCGDIPHKRFQVLPPDPHRFDGDKDGIGCES